MEFVDQLCDIFNQVKLSGFNSLFEIFLPLGFGIFAAKKALPWVLDIYTHFRKLIADLKALKEMVSKYHQEGQNQNSEYIAIEKIKAKVNEKRISIEKREENLTSASRIDFLQLGIFTFAMLILAALEEAIFQTNQLAFFIYLIFILNIISILFYCYRHYTFKMEGSGYELINDGIIHFKEIFNKGGAILFFLFVCCTVPYFYIPHNLLSINMVFIVISILINLIFPFYFLYKRGKLFNAQLIEEPFELFEKKIGDDLNQLS